MAVSKNMFAHVSTREELADLFNILTSPENLYADGELTHAQAKTRYNRLVLHYQHRESELRIAELNAVRNS